MKKIGFIGVGNMGGTLAKVAQGFAGKENILVSSRTFEKAATFAAENGFVAVSNETLAQQAHMIFLGVKPHQMEGLLKSIAPILAERTDDFVLVSMAAGLSTRQIEQMAGGKPVVLRIMPNTPSLVGKGSIPYCAGQYASEETCAELEAVLNTAGWVAPLPEPLIDAASAVAGCGPAFVYVFIEALADAGVACGLPRRNAIELAAQMVSGAAQMVLESKQHTGALKDAVCSPGGSTIAGVCALEEYGFRSAAQKAVLAAYARTKELGK